MVSWKIGLPCLGSEKKGKPFNGIRNNAMRAQEEGEKENGRKEKTRERGG